MKSFAVLYRFWPMNHMKRYECVVQDVSRKIFRPRYVKGFILWVVVKS